METRDGLRAAATYGVAAAFVSLKGRSVAVGRLRRWVRTFAHETRAQDLLEYALLSAVIGLVGLAVLNGVSTMVNRYYGQSTSSVNGLWHSPDPSGS